MTLLLPCVVFPTACSVFAPTDQPKWDTWGRLFEPLLSHVPLMHVNGNHEIEPLANGGRDTSYNHRYPTPQLTGHDYNAGEPVPCTLWLHIWNCSSITLCFAGRASLASKCNQAVGKPGV
jgi:hypothetical protein